MLQRWRWPLPVIVRAVQAWRRDRGEGRGRWVYSRILVPLDGSRLAEHVLPFVRLLGRELPSRVELLYVQRLERSVVSWPLEDEYASELPPSRLEGYDPIRQTALIDAARRSEAEAYLQKMVASLEGEGLTASYHLREGAAASQIVAEAETDPNTLIAMATHGRSGITRWALGSVTDKVLHASTGPLLVVRSTEEGAIPAQVALKALVVPLDGSPLAEEVLPHVVALSNSLSLSVILVRILAGDPVSGHDAGALEQIRGVSRALRAQGVTSVTEAVLHGNAAGAIVDIAQTPAGARGPERSGSEAAPESLIAMTTHGRSGIGRWVLGSVTDRVVSHSRAPVLVIRSAGAPVHAAGARRG